MHVCGSCRFLLDARTFTPHVYGSTPNKSLFHGTWIDFRDLLLVSMSTLQLPKLTREPEKYYGSSTFLSEQFIHSLRNLLPRAPNLVLSIGSGLSLIESLVRSDDEYRVECVEVPSLQHEPKYVAEDMMHYVKGTWDTCERAYDAAAWLFIFPRDPQLLATYVSRYGHGRVAMILWIGPAGDAKDYKSALPIELCGWSSPLHGLPLQPSEAALVWRLPRTDAVSNVTDPSPELQDLGEGTVKLREDEIEGL